LSILPDLDDSILDKLMLFKLGDWQPDFSMAEGVEARIERELPFFLRRLLAYEVPAHIQGDPRFGVKCFHHPELVREANNASANGQLVQLMAAGLRLRAVWAEPKEASRWMSAVDVRTMLDIDGLRGSLQKYAGNRLGIALSSLGKPLVLDQRWLHGTKQYLINLNFRLDEPSVRK